jgi:hypothetical protein
MEADRRHRLYAAIGGGMEPGTIATLEALLIDIALLPGPLCCTAANGPWYCCANWHQSAAREFGLAFAQLRPPIEARFCAFA